MDISHTEIQTIKRDIRFFELEEYYLNRSKIVKELGSITTKKHFLLKAGKIEGYIKLGASRLYIRPGSLYIFSSKFYLENIQEFKKAEDATLLVIPESYLITDISMYHLVKYLKLYQNRDFIHLEIDKDSFDWLYISVLFNKIKKILLNDISHYYHSKGLRTNIEALSFVINEIHHQVDNNIKSETEINYDAKKFIDFLELVHTHPAINYSITFYTEKLLISTSKLTTICLKNAEDTPHNIIREIILEKAKELLNSSDSSIKEIGYELGFSLPTNFNKFFTAIEGITPRKFRMQNREIDHN